MSNLLKVFKWGALVFGTMWGVTLGCNLVSANDSFAVVIGFLLLLGILGCWINVLAKGALFMYKKYGKFFGVAAMAFIALLSIAGCDFIPPGHVGVMVDLYGSNKGVQGTTLVTGRVWYNPYTTSIYSFPTFMQYKVWTKSTMEGNPTDESITFVSRDRIQVNVDVSVAYQFEPNHVPQLFVTFRQPPDVIADTYIRSRVRDAFVRNGGNIDATDILGAGVGQLDQEVLNTVNTEMTSIGIHFDYISVIGHARIPQQIQDAINAAIESTQQAKQAQNQVAVVKAQADQAVAEAVGKANAVRTQADGDAEATLARATAQAKANQLLSASLTSELIQYNAIQQWDGKVPMYSGTGAVPFLNLNQK